MLGAVPTERQGPIGVGRKVPVHLKSGALVDLPPPFLVTYSQVLAASTCL